MSALLEEFAYFYTFPPHDDTLAQREFWYWTDTNPTRRLGQRTPSGEIDLRAIEVFGDFFFEWKNELVPFPVLLFPDWAAMHEIPPPPGG
jgi:hypothetical protein